MRVSTLLLFCFLACRTILAQTDTEIYLFDITGKGSEIKLTNFKNISNEEGYDNQPFFLGKNALLFSGTINNNTEIVKYLRGKKTPFNLKTLGGEYSPQVIPNDRAISAVRLDPDGRQRLYRYEPRKVATKELVSDAVIAYYTWADKNTIVSASIVNNKLHLVMYDLQTNKSDDLGIIVGRSFHKIPHSNLVSFIDKSQAIWYLKSINPLTKKIKNITALPMKVEDIAWLPNGSLLATHGASIFLKSKKEKNWKILKTFEDENLKNLSRLAVSPEGNQLALVSEVSPATIVQKRIDPFNHKEIEAFLKIFSESVVVNNFQADTLFKGKEQLRSNYNKIFQNQKSQTLSVLNRIIYKNIVIDEELLASGDEENKQVTIYKVANGKITSITFISPSTLLKEAPTIVDKQLKNYNDHNIQGFIERFSNDAIFIKYPSEIAFPNLDAVRNSHQKMFEAMPSLKATIKNRITIGDYVIDHEELTTDENLQDRVVIKKVTNGKIAQVVFIE